MKYVIVTGIYGGLGREIFNQLSEEVDVLLCGIARRFHGYQKESSGDKIKLVQIDLKDVLQLYGSLEKIFKPERMTHIEKIVYINNAATIDPIGQIGSLPSQKIIEAVSVNQISPFIITEFFVNVSQKINSDFDIINLTSGAARNAIDGWACYCATKSANEMFFNVLKAQRFDSISVRVFNYDPGLMATEMQSKIRKATSKDFPKVNEFVGFFEEKKLFSVKEVAQKLIEGFLR